MVYGNGQGEKEMKNNIYKKSMSGRAKGIIGILLVMLAVAGIFFWESYGREAFTYASITVLNEDLEKGTVVTADMLRTTKIDQSNLIKYYVKNPNEIIGKQTVTFLPADLQLSKKFFKKQGLVPQKGEYVMAIPKEWILAYPQTIRRGDTVYLYPTKNLAENFVNENGDITQADKSNSRVKAKVTYVKDSASREVVDVEQKRKGGLERKDASAVIATIEIIIDDARYEVMRELAEAGNKFIISYN